MAGRPLKFKNAKELQDKIDAYFASCFELDGYWVSEKIKKGKNKGETEDVWYQHKDPDGNPRYKQIKPFTVTGLANALGTTRDILLDYEERDEFSNTIKQAKGFIHEYAEEYLFNGKNQTAAIFNLKNNWGWRDKTETDVTTAGESINFSIPAEIANKNNINVKRENETGQGDQETPENMEEASATETEQSTGSANA